MSAEDTTPLTEDDIRPAVLNHDKEAAYARDVERLLRRRDEFVEVPCPACGTEGGDQVWTKWTLSYLECPECGTVYISPRPSPDVVEEYYATSELYAYWNEHIFPASEDVRRERIFRPRVERVRSLCERYGISPSLLVEVGAGFGTFCAVAMESGLFERVLAIEPTPSLAARCRERGVDVIALPVEHVTIDEPVDVVASFEVIEHLFDPRTFVQRCFEILRPGGLLVLSCPNARGFEVLTLGPIADTVDTEHLNYFNPGSLAGMAASVGFDVLETSTPGVLDADIVRNKILLGAYDVTDQAFLRTVLIDRYEELGAGFQDFLQASNLSSHMWLAARKPLS